LNLLIKIGQEHIIWGMNNFELPTTEYFFVWDKQQTVNNFASAELAYTDIKCPAKIYHYSIHLHNQTIRQHATQKPVGLIQWCLGFSKTKGFVLDPFLGSGTTAVACEKLNRRWIGIEISEKYCEIAKSRIKAEADQLKLL
jgi:tRNA/tmRNA/rRNA uracil-C5-methylase (TrmA/RlmC/RlmD family)